jgi:hypothetical protein
VQIPLILSLWRPIKLTLSPDFLPLQASIAGRGGLGFPHGGWFCVRSWGRACALVAKIAAIKLIAQNAENIIFEVITKLLQIIYVSSTFVPVTTVLMLQECILPGDLEAVMEKSGRNFGALS